MNSASQAAVWGLSMPSYEMISLDEQKRAAESISMISLDEQRSAELRYSDAPATARSLDAFAEFEFSRVIRRYVVMIVGVVAVGAVAIWISSSGPTRSHRATGLIPAMLPTPPRIIQL